MLPTTREIFTAVAPVEAYVTLIPVTARRDEVTPNDSPIRSQQDVLESSQAAVDGASTSTDDRVAVGDEFIIGRVSQLLAKRNPSLI